MNHMEEVAKLLGVEIGEEFEIKGINGNYKLKDDGLEFIIESKNRFMHNGTLIDLLLGKVEIVKKSFYPKIGQHYFYPSYEHGCEGYSSNHFDNDFIDKMIGKTVGFFRTKEEAIEEAKKRGWID